MSSTASGCSEPCPALNVSGDRTFTISPGNLCQRFTTPFVKKLLPHISSKATLLQFETSVPCPVTIGPAQQFVPIFLTSPSRTRRLQQGLTRAFPFPVWATPALSSFPHRKIISPIMFVSLLWTYSSMYVSFLCWDSQSGMQYWRWALTTVEEMFCLCYEMGLLWFVK